MEETVTIKGVKRKLRMGVVPNLAHDMLLGRDWEGLERLPKARGLVEKVEESYGSGIMEMLQVDRRQVSAWQQDDECLQEWLRSAQPGKGEGT